MAIIFRQTNAVWVAFTLAVSLFEDFAPSVISTGGVGTNTATSQNPTDAGSSHAKKDEGQGQHRQLTSSDFSEHYSGYSERYSGKSDEGGSPSFTNSAVGVNDHGFDEHASVSVVNKQPLFARQTSSARRRKTRSGGGLQPKEATGRRGEASNKEKRWSDIKPTENAQQGERPFHDTNLVDGHERCACYRSLDRQKDGGGNSGEHTTAARCANFPCPSSLPPLPRLVSRLVTAAFNDACRGGAILRFRMPLAVPALLFALFVWGFNGGAVVLGDKENHSPGGAPHLAQLAYLVAAGASLWGLVGQEAVLGGNTRNNFRRWIRNVGLVGFVAIVGVVALALWR